jgi:hypothetical protein
MKITLSRQEIEQILIDYANNLVKGYGFNEVVTSSYRDIPSSVDLVKEVPPSVDLVKEEPKEQE